jgi:hypothetical protein
MAGAQLDDFQWELGDVVFGLDQPIAHEADSDPGSYSWRTQTVSNPGGDGRSFGVDLIDPGTWNFRLYTDCEDDREALAELAKIAKVWRGDAVRRTSGAVMALRYALGGRTRVVYGRPRRFSAPLDNRMTSGLIMITSDFELASELYFDDVENSIEVGTLPPSTGGFESDFETPLATEESDATQPYAFTVDGELPTPGIFEFKGPAEDPWLLIDDSTLIKLRGTIAYDTTITVDARPWVMSAYRHDGAGVAGMLSRETILPRLLLEPGLHTAAYGGNDASGTSRATVRWRGAHPSV